MRLSVHPAAALLPDMPAGEFDALVADIKANGQREPVVLLDGMVLDGRHRVKACERLGIAPRTTGWSGDGDAMAWVLSMNLHRRHLTASQRAALAVEVEGYYAAEAAERMRAGKKAPDPSPDLGQGPLSGKAIDHAAKATGASRSNAEKAKAVKKADPAAFEKVKAGQTTVDKAHREASEAIALADAAERYPFLGGVPAPTQQIIATATALDAIEGDAERERRTENARKWAAMKHRQAGRDDSERRRAEAVYAAVQRAFDGLVRWNVDAQRALDASEDLMADDLVLGEWDAAIRIARGHLDEFAKRTSAARGIRRVK